MPGQGPRGGPTARALPRTPGVHRASLPEAINSKSWLCNTNEVSKEKSSVQRIQPPSPEGGEGRGRGPGRRRKRSGEGGRAPCTWSARTWSAPTWKMEAEPRRP